MRELEEFFAGTLTPETRELIAKHLVECPRCDPRRKSAPAPAGLDLLSGSCSGPDTVPYPPLSQPTSLPTPNSLPEKIGKYFVIEALGKGGFAEVFLAKDPDHEGRFVAVKIPRRDREFRGESAIDGFLKEARASASLKHPRIVQVYDWGRDEQVRCYVVLQRIGGRTLAEVFKTQRPDPVRLCDILIDVAEALKYIHSLGQVHRDVKPANVLVDGRAWLSDFGLAIVERERWEHANERAGTDPYMAPEQIRGEAALSRGLADVWSFGVVMYEGLTGRRPFSAANREHLFNDIENGIPRKPRDLDPGIPEALERVCLKCLEKHPADRCDMGQALDALKRWRRRRMLRRALFAAVPALALSAVLLAAVEFRRDRTVPERPGPRPVAVGATSTPMVAYASSPSKNSIVRVNEVENTVQLVSDNLFLVKLGRLDLADSQVRITIAPIAAGADAGVFLGFRDRSTDGRRQFQRIRIVKQPNGVVNSWRATYVFDPATPDSGNSIGFPLGLLDKAPRENTIEVRTTAGRLTEIRWNGQRIDEVQVAGFDPEVLDVTGLFGVYTNNTAAVFSRFEVNGRSQLLHPDRSDR